MRRWVFHNAGIKTILLSLVLAGFGAFGLWQLTRGIGDIWEAWESGGWPATTGTILSAKVQAHQGRHRSSYTPAVSYSYTVGAQSFTGRTITPGRMWPGNSAFAAMKMYGVESHPEVFYSPSQPGQSVLVPGLHLYNWEPALLGLLVFSFAAFFGVFSALGPTYGQPDGRGGFNFDKGPVGRVFLWAMLLLFAEFGVVWFVATRG